MTKFDAWLWCERCHGLEIYIGIVTVTLYIEGQQFMGNDLIEVVEAAIKAGF